MTWEEAVLWLRAQPAQAELVRACFYDDPLDAAAERYRESSEWRAIRALLPARRGKALDLGAGRGIASYALARDGWMTTALEPDPSGVVGAAAIRSLAEQSGVKISVSQDRGERLPFADGSFALVFARAVLHHARDLSALCREAARVLAPGGFFIAAREHVVSSPAQLRKFLEAHPLHRHYGGEHAYRLREYKEAIVASNLKLTQVLNPFSSDINLFPDTREALRARIAMALRLPYANLIPRAALDAIGALHREPGRLYTFVAMKIHV